MDYTQITPQQQQHMLQAIGARSLEDLFAPIPRAQRFAGELKIPAGCSEPELLAELEALARRNRPVGELVCFLGAGAYDHFVPTVVEHLAMRGEFLTAYTPYQAEASQGTLQAFYEFQTMICQITGLDVSNASLYDGATAAAEAMLMARAATQRSRLLVSGAVHPDTVTTLSTYAVPQELELVSIPTRNGLTDVARLESMLNDATMAVLVQTPNFLGCIEDLGPIAEMAHRRGALLIVAFDPLAAGVLRRPGDLGADIVVGEGQPLGIPLQYGGPYLGFLSAREEHLRRMPGRVVGVAHDAQGRRGFCLVLQTREQHIKRERATSNVCTNQGLMAMRAAVYMSALGRSGLAKVAGLCLDKSHYAAAEIARLPGFRLRFSAPFFKEFVVQTEHNVERLLEKCRERGILAGVPLECWFPELKDCFAVAVTEKRTRSEIDALVAALKQ